MSKLQELRKAQGLSTQALAEKTGLNKRMIEKYENGERDIGAAAARSVLALARALGCSVADLID